MASHPHSWQLIVFSTIKRLNRGYALAQVLPVSGSGPFAFIMFLLVNIFFEICCIVIIYRISGDKSRLFSTDHHLQWLLGLRAELDRNIQMLRMRSVKRGDLTVHSTVLPGDMPLPPLFVQGSRRVYEPSARHARRRAGAQHRNLRTVLFHLSGRIAPPGRTHRRLHYTGRCACHSRSRVL